MIFSPFFKLNWMKTYDGIITTPINVSPRRFLRLTLSTLETS